jgi:hypothetical protein
MAKAIPSSGGSWPAEGLPIDAACERVAGPLWDVYVNARAAARGLDDLSRRVLALRADEERRLAHCREARAAVDAQFRSCLEPGEFELWARPGSPIAKAEHIPTSAVGGLEFDYEQRSARGERGMPPLYDVRVRKAAAAAPLDNSEPEEADGSSASKLWIVAEARRMKAAGEIPDDIRITDFARQLAHRMHKAAKADRSIRPIKAASIKNKLKEWGIWPVAFI